MTDLNWFAMYLGAPKREFDARDAVLALGFDSFCPVEYKLVLRSKTHPKHRLKRRRPYPVCIRYGFVGMPASCRWSDVLEDHAELATKVIRGTDIPARLLGMSPSKPTPLPKDQIEALAALNDRNVPYAASANPHRAILEVRVGQVAKIINPAFYGHSGRVDEVIANRARVAIQFLGALRQVEVSVDELEAA